METTNKKNENLNRFAHNLIEQAKEGKLDPVIGRDEEIRRVLQILSRRTKNNPVLVGEPGVGKPVARARKPCKRRCAAKVTTLISARLTE